MAKTHVPGADAIGEDGEYRSPLWGTGDKEQRTVLAEIVYSQARSVGTL